MRNGKERNYQSFGYLKEVHHCSEDEKIRHQALAKAMNAVLIVGRCDGPEKEEMIAEAKKRCEQLGFLFRLSLFS